MLRRILVSVCVGAAAAALLCGAESSPATRPATQASAKPADNSYCLTCHINFQKETLVTVHQKVGIGCDNCHGESDKHSSDENGITPPDIMYAKAAVNDSCIKCHDRRKLAKEPTGAHGPILAGTAETDKYCDDCHGKHSMAVRTRRWDKVTRKLIADDGVRMVQDKPEPKK